MNYSISICKIILFLGINYCFNTLTRRRIIMNSDYKNKQCIISSKNKKSFCNDEAKWYIENNDIYNNKKLITISPGGFKGFYLLGILTYLKENYILDDCIYSGASAGAWNSLFMCYKGDESPLNFIYKFLDENIKKTKSITDLQYYLKYKILSNHKDNEFDLSRLFIGVTTLNNFMPCINIYSDFENLEDAINCCMASSHIPFVTGGVYNRYKNMFSFDGGFSTYPYLNKDRLLHISLSMWDNIIYNESNFIKRNINTVKKFSDFFSISKNNLLELFDNGYQDAKNHKEYFDGILERKINYENIELF
jgi:hypothetical protein